MKHLFACLLALSLAALSPSLVARDLDIDGDGLIEIYTLEDLDEIRNNLDGSSLYGSSEGCEPACIGFELVNDLDFDTNKNGMFDEGDKFYNDGKGWLPIGDIVGAPFTGRLVGNYREIRNMTQNFDDIESQSGLFIHLYSTSVRAVKIVNANITSGEFVSVLANWVSDSTIDEVSISGTASSTCTSNYAVIGGISNYILDSTVSRSIINVDITSSCQNSYIGGAAYWAGNLSITDSIIAGRINIIGAEATFGNLGGVVATADESFSLTNSLVVTEIDHNADVHPGFQFGVFAAESFYPALIDSSYWNNETLLSSEEILTPGGLSTAEIACPVSPDEMLCDPTSDIYASWSEDNWYFGTSNQTPIPFWLEDRDLDDNGLIEINSLADLDEMRNDLYGTSLYGRDTGCYGGAAPCFGYELATELDFDTNADGVIDSRDSYWNDGLGWLPVGGDENGPFFAAFRGNNHKINNLYINRPDRRSVGLIGYWILNTETQSNVGLVFDGHATSVTGYDSVGIVAGEMSVNGQPFEYVDIRHGKVTGAQNVGGVTGQLYHGSVFQKIRAHVDVYAEYSVGGIAGELIGDCTDCYSSGSITGTAYGAGGLAGGLNGNLHNVYSRARVSSGGVAGGLTGYSIRSSTNAYWDTQTSGQATDASSAIGLTSEQMRCPTAPSDTSCLPGTTIYNSFDPDVWSFGTSDQYPVLHFNGYAFHDQDNDDVEDQHDAFPETRAASLDEDGDGLPDAWHRWCDSTCQLASGLTLDPDPTNVQPVAAVSGPYEFTLGDNLQLDASGSTDTDGSIVLYEWDLDNDGTFDDALGVTPEVSGFFSTAGSYPVAVRVTDDDGATDEASSSVVVLAAPKDKSRAGATPISGYLLLCAYMLATGRRSRIRAARHRQ